MNLANQVTIARFAVTVVYFVALAVLSSEGAGASAAFLDAVLVLFVVAAGSDVVDGYLARRYGTVTAFGRVADPFVDKILVCGSLVFLAAAPITSRLLPAWVVVCILAREFVVHGVRAEVEAQGTAFGATWWGKLKMALQSLAVGGLLLHWGRLRDAAWAETTTRALVWASLLCTVVSGALYLREARAILRPPAGGSGGRPLGF